MALPPWRALLRGAREREGRSPAARWLQLATVAADGSPRVRTLVFRGWAGDTGLDLLTDARSAKAAELERQPAVELCWLLPRARMQFRLRGAVVPLSPALELGERQRHWQGLSPGGRAVWGWPAPGEALQADGPFPDALEDGTPLPAHLLLLRIALTQVELLELMPQPHRRRRWRLEDGWRERALNPSSLASPSSPARDSLSSFSSFSSAASPSWGLPRDGVSRSAGPSSRSRLPSPPQAASRAIRLAAARKRVMGAMVLGREGLPTLATEAAQIQQRGIRQGRIGSVPRPPAGEAIHQSGGTCLAKT